MYYSLGNRQRRRLCSSSGDIDSDTVLWYIQQGTINCKVGKIKTKFHGTSSRLCQIASRILIRLMRTQLEARVCILFLLSIQVIIVVFIAFWYTNYVVLLTSL